MKFIATTPAPETGKPIDYSLIFVIKGDKIEVVMPEKAEEQKKETIKK